MKKFAFIFAAILLSACTKETTEISGKFQIPEDLKDCKFYQMSNEQGFITVVRCPNSQTASKTSTKNSKAVIVIDGVNYEAVEK